AIRFLIPDRRAHALGVVLTWRTDVTPRDTDDLVALERRGESESIARGVAQKHSLEPFVIRGLVAEDGVVYAVDLGRSVTYFGLREVSKLHAPHAFGWSWRSAPSAAARSSAALPQRDTVMSPSPCHSAARRSSMATRAGSVPPCSHHADCTRRIPAARSAFRSIRPAMRASTRSGNE